MLTMERLMAFLILAISILLFAKGGNAMAPRSFKQILANLADKYGNEMIERNVEIRNSGNFQFLSMLQLKITKITLIIFCN